LNWMDAEKKESQIPQMADLAIRTGESNSRTGD